MSCCLAGAQLPLASRIGNGQLCPLCLISNLGVLQGPAALICTASACHCLLSGNPQGTGSWYL